MRTDSLIRPQNRTAIDMKISTITLNPALDRAMYFESPFRTGVLNRASHTVTAVGGKGINLSRAARRLGIPSDAYGFIGGPSGDMIKQCLADEGANPRLTVTDAETRCCIKLIDSEGTCTEANERGGPITQDEFERLIREIERGAHFSTTTPDFNEQYFVMGGSIPQGVEKDVYFHIINMLNNIKVKAVVDTSGEALKLAVKASPYMIKPNSDELYELTGRRAETREEAVEICREVYNSTGIRVLCTLGKNGSAYVGPEGVSTSRAFKVCAKSFAGAGDTYLAAFLSRYKEDNKPRIDEAMRFGASAAAAKVELEGTVFPDAAAMAKYF